MSTVTGIYRGGRIELLDEAPQVPDETQVVVLFPEPGEDRAARIRAAEAMLAEMRAGIDFGGERFNREEIYAERIDRIARRTD
jgi:hypothetical protein